MGLPSITASRNGVKGNTSKISRGCPFDITESTLLHSTGSKHPVRHEYLFAVLATLSYPDTAFGVFPMAAEWLSG